MSSAGHNHRVRTLVLALIVLAVGCASAPRARVAAAVERGDLDAALVAYERFRSSEGADHDLLARMATLLLEREARSEDPAVRRAAIQQLALAGTAGMPALVRLADAEGVTPARLEALETLARRNHEPARLALRSLADSEDPEILAASVLGMDPALDRDLLLSLAGSPHARVRKQALDALGALTGDPDVARLLAEAARVDPDPTVRAAAVRGLGRAGESPVAILSERLSDPDAGVRLAAVAALASDARGREALAPMLEIGPAAAGIEAARVLLNAPDTSAALEARARAFLLEALAADDPALRAQAGVAFASLPADREPPLDALRAALSGEADPNVRLAFARALWRHDRAAAREALSALLHADAMPRVQAAALLASEGDREARAVLAEVLGGDGAPILRRTAARALARDAMDPDAARRALSDEDALVRVYAAGGILAAAVAS